MGCLWRLEWKKAFGGYRGRGVKRYLGRPEWKKAFRGYRGGVGVTMLFGETGVEEGFWRVQGG